MFSSRIWSSPNITRRTRRSAVHGDLQGGNVVAASYLCGQLQHAGEHGRHKLRMRDTPLLNELQIAFRVEAFHDDDGAAGTDGQVHPRLRRRMVKRSRREINHPLAAFPKIVQEVEDREVLDGRLLRERS